MDTHFYQDHKGDTKSILVVNAVGIMRRVYAPFKVVCIIGIAGIGPGTQVYVDEVKGSLNGQLYFVIFQRSYPHRNFRLTIKF